MARPKTKFKIELDKEMNQKLEDIATKTNSDQSAVLRHAIELYNLVVDAHLQGHQLFLADNTPKVIAKITGIVSDKTKDSE